MLKGERTVREDRIGIGSDVWEASKILRASSGINWEGRLKRTWPKSCVSLCVCEKEAMEEALKLDKSRCIGWGYVGIHKGKRTCIAGGRMPTRDHRHDGQAAWYLDWSNISPTNRSRPDRRCRL